MIVPGCVLTDQGVADGDNNQRTTSDYVRSFLPLLVMLATLEAIDILFALELMPAKLAACWWQILEVAHLMTVTIGLMPPLYHWLTRPNKNFQD